MFQKRKNVIAKRKNLVNKYILILTVLKAPLNNADQFESFNVCPSCQGHRESLISMAGYPRLRIGTWTKTLMIITVGVTPNDILNDWWSPTSQDMSEAGEVSLVSQLAKTRL